MQSDDQAFARLLERIPELVMVLDATGTIRQCSPVSETLLGRRAAEVVGVAIGDWTHPEDRERLQQALLERPVSAESRLAHELRLRHRDGAWRWFEIHLNHLAGGDGGAVLSCRDVTSRKAIEEQLTRQAFYDTTTGLANRALLLDRLEHALTGVTRSGGNIAAFFIDLDGFKAVNDRLGHAVGDTVLAAIAARLLRAVRPGDTVARFGGDEFVVLVDADPHPAEAERLGRRMVAAIARPITVDGREVCVTASIGAAIVTPEHGPMRAADLLAQADAALYRAKVAGKAQVALYEPRDGARTLEPRALGNELRLAIADDDLSLYYQPEVDLATGRVVAVEALVRWRHAQRGLLRPDQFIALAEEESLILPLGRWVLTSACRQAAIWRARFPAHRIVVGVNLSDQQLRQAELVTEVNEILETTGLEPDMLRLEMHESGLLRHSADVQPVLWSLRGMGIGLALDNFGTGYSAISSLRRFPIETLKIDRAFAESLAPRQQRSAVMKALVALAHGLDLQVVAEGVETADEVADLERIRCDRAQGFYFAHPAPGEALLPYLAANLTLPGAAPRPHPGEMAVGL